MKQGQATIYAILGIVIVSIIVLTFTFKDTLFKSQWEQNKEKALLVPEKAKKVQAYSESCIQQVLEEGVNLLASQGGYIDIPPDPVPPSPFNPLSNKLDLFNTGTAHVAYWYYETANGVQKNQIPSKSTMQIQLATYVNTNLPSCINNFHQFKQLGYKITNANIKTDIDIAENIIFATTNYPIELYYEGLSFAFEDFYVSLDHGLGKMHEQAQAIMEAENNENFIENYIIDTMVVYDEIPYSGVDFKCSPRSWQRAKVNDDLKKIIATNIPLIKIKGTDYVLPQQKDKYFEVQTSSSARDLSVQFISSPEWPSLINILGEEGPIIRGKPYTTDNAMSKFMLQFFCLNQYHFVYDLKVPILITLTDKDDNIFQFATLAIINHNQPRENKQLLTNTFDVDDSLCEPKNQLVKVNALGFNGDGSLRPLNGARISLKCITSTCPLGTTSGDGSLEASAPQCLNALISAEKEGFHHTEEFISTHEQATSSLLLEPKYTLDVEVQVIDTLNNVRPLQPTEQVIISFENHDKGFTTSYVSPGQTTVSLIAGTYTMKSTLLVNSDPPFKFDEQKIEVCIDAPKNGVLGVLGLSEKQCTTEIIEATSIPSITSGGSIITWSPSRPQLATAKKVTLYVVRSTTPQSITELAQTQQEVAENAKKTKLPDLE
jgi:hypothetical protein